MARLNLRLTCSLLAVGAVLLLSLLPSTRTLVERQFWILSGSYEERIGLDANRFARYEGADDDRIVTLLRGYDRIPVEARAFELAGIAARRNDPALWAHVILQTSMMTVPTKPNPNSTDMDRLRGHTFGQIELTAARAGQKLDPRNAFFRLAEATALCKMERWQEVGPVLAGLAKTDVYDDYIFDQFRRRVEWLHRSLGTMLPSDYVRDWAAIMFPHLANYKGLSRVRDVLPPAERDRAAYGLAHAGLIMEKYPDVRITRLVGTAMVKRAVNGEPVDHETPSKSLQPALDGLIARAHAAGDTSLEAGWRALLSWKQPDYNITTADEGMLDSAEPMTAVDALYLLGMIGAISAALWVGAQIDPSAGKVVNVGLILVGVVAFASPTVERIIIIASTALFVSFLLVRLPGRERAGYILALFAILGATLPFLFVSGPEQLAMPAVLTAMWAIPFAIARFIKRAAPAWVGVGLSTLFFAFAFWVLGRGLTKSPVEFGHYIFDMVSVSVALGIFTIGFLIATIMAISKLNLPDALRVTARPLPLCALVVSGVFVWSIRDMVGQEKVWDALSAKELPKRYLKVMAEAEVPVPVVRDEAPERIVAPAASSE